GRERRAPYGGGTPPLRLQPSSCASTDISTLFFMMLLIGHPFLAPSASSRNFAASRPGTLPFTVSVLDFTSKPPPALGPNVTTQVVSSFVAGFPVWASACENAMEKQLACEAASSSSGVVWAAAPSVRAFQLRFASLNVPLAALVVPWPLIRSPSHIAVARLSIAASKC